MPYAFSNRSLDRLQTCHQDLILLMRSALIDPECPSDITVLEGHRNKARQNQMVDEGKSQLDWPHSRHNTWPSMAVDVAPYILGAVSWDWDYYHPLAAHIRATWNRLLLIAELQDGQRQLVEAAGKPVVIDAEVRAALANVPPACVVSLGGDPMTAACSMQLCWSYGQSSAQRPPCDEVTEAALRDFQKGNPSSVALEP